MLPCKVEKYDAYVFDFDGVIVESNSIKHQLFYDIWEEFLDTKIVSEILSVNRNRFEQIERSYDQLLTKKEQELYTLESFIDKYTQWAEDRIVNNGLKDEVLQTFQILKPKQLFINSATPDATLKIICKKLEIDSFFKEILGLNRTKEENFKLIFEQYGVRPEKTLFFGDMKSDKCVAEALGIDFVPIKSIGSDLDE